MKEKKKHFATLKHANIIEYVQSTANERKVLKIVIATATVKDQEETSGQKATAEKTILYKEPAIFIKNTAEVMQEDNLFNLNIFYRENKSMKFIVPSNLRKARGIKKLKNW